MRLQWFHAPFLRLSKNRGEEQGGNVEVIKAIREKLYEPEFSDFTVVDFSDLAQGCKTYDEFIEKMKGVSEGELNYSGVAICGTKRRSTN